MTARNWYRILRISNHPTVVMSSDLEYRLGTSMRSSADEGHTPRLRSSKNGEHLATWTSSLS
jgi:hypothetical protein